MHIGTALIALALASLGGWFAYEATGFPASRTPGEPGPAFLPIAYGLLLLALGVLVAALQTTTIANRSTVTVHHPARIFIAFIGMVAYIWLLPTIGYYPATIAVVAGIIILFGGRWPVAVGVAGGFLAFIFVVFDYALRVPLP